MIHFHKLNLLLTVFLALAATGCASNPPNRVATSVPEIVDDLFTVAERNTVLGPIRVYMVEIHESHEAAERERRGDKDVLDPISCELEHQFVVAMSRKMNVIDDEVAKKGVPAVVNTSAEGSDQRAKHPDATHLVIGDYARRIDNKLNVTVRLVEADSLVIVAAARGVLPQEEIGLDLRKTNRPMP